MSKNELNAYSVGLLRLREMKIDSAKFTSKDIEFIGRCSINREKIIIGKDGDDWTIMGHAKEFEQTHYGTMPEEYFKVIGKRCVRFYRGPKRDRSKPVWRMTAEELFRAAKGQRPSRRHAAKLTPKERIANSIRMEKPKRK